MTRLLLKWSNRGAQPLEKPLRDELLGIEGLEERALALAASFVVDSNPRRRARNIYPRFHENARVLRHAYRVLAEDVREGVFITSAAEWLLDNFHLVTSEIRDIRQNLPKRYYAQLPTLASPDLSGHSRIYAIAVEIVRHSDSRLDRPQLAKFLNSFQRVAPLTIGELWAWPSMLRLALIENMRRLAEEILDGRNARLAADAYLSELELRPDTAGGALPATVLSVTGVVQLLHRVREYGFSFSPVRALLDEHLAAQRTSAEDAIRGEHQRQAITQVSIANAITSLRLCSVLDWRQYFESVSLVEQVLQRDPASVYRRMDFLSRDRLRQAVEELAGNSGDAQLRVALRAVESARQASTRVPLSDRRAHVGFHLVGGGRRQLEADLGYRPRRAKRARRLVFRHATAVYLTPILAIAAILLGLVGWYLQRQNAATWLAVLALVLLAVPALDIGIAVIQRVIAWAVPPRRLLRLDFTNRVPEEARTMVVVPTLLTSVDAVDTLLEHLEIHALGNLDPSIHFAILSDFADATAPHLPGDEAILDAAQAGIEALNGRLGPDHANRFFLFHRDRQWNAGEQVWMGWERKRGKLEEFNRLLRGATDTSFVLQVGDLSVLPLVRYCLTLDSDTRLPRDAARELLGVMVHPQNRAWIDPHLRRVTEGYAILQPRVSVTMSSAAGSLFARTYAGHTGLDPYTTAVSDVYQDLFDEGIYTGKGLYDVDAFGAALEGRVPENALLSHDLFEGLYARTALVSDVEVVDDYPSSVLAHTRRQHRWVRGDWQILWWLLPYVPTRAGWQRNTLPLISRWKIFDNLRRSLLAPTIVASLVLGWTLLPGRPLAWTAIGLAAVVLPLLLRSLKLLVGPSRTQTLPVFLRTTGSELAADLARVSLHLAFLPHQAAEMLHAIALTLYRLAFTRRRLLEWETSAAIAKRTGAAQLLSFVRDMRVGIAIGAAVLLLVAIAKRGAIPTAFPISALWMAAPAIAFLLSRPAKPRREELTNGDRDYLQKVAAKTWQYFATFATDEHHALPPDNVQMVPQLTVAARSSPTNIGVAMLSNIAAFDLGFIPLDTCLTRSEAVLDTLERLEHYEGHLLNWYDTRTLAPLLPKYVSTVDSGNLAASLIVLASACAELADTLDPLVEAQSVLIDRLQRLGARAREQFDAMNFRFLYDAERQLFTIGFRLADAERPGRRDPSFYDLLASEARVASFLAIAKGDVPESHWFHLGRSVTSVHGAPVLLSWSATMFEYLMPMLVMRSYPDTLLDKTNRMVVKRQMEYASAHGVPWGISESAYNVVDRHETYQYKAFGVPSLGLKRGLGDEIVVAPYATALAAMISPSESVRNFRRLARLGLEDEYGFFDAIDYTHRPEDDADEVTLHPASGTVVKTVMAHHAGMTLVSLANVLLDDRMVARFHADARVRATELLLQERVPRYAPTIAPRPLQETRVSTPAPPVPVRRYRTGDTPFPHAQFLSNGNYVVAITNAGGGASFCRGLAVTRWRRDPTRDPGSSFVYLRDVRTGMTWSATSQPTPLVPDDYSVEFRAEKATFVRKDGDITTRLELAVSTEDDVEVRRISIINHGSRIVEIDVTSYVEVVMAPAADDLAHPAFAKLFLETEYLPESQAIICRRRPRDSRDPATYAIHVLSLEGRPQGPVEWETDRARFVGRGRDVDAPVALDGRALSGTTGTVLDPIFSLRQRIRLAPGASTRLAFATGLAADRETAHRLAQKYHDSSAMPRTFALAFTHAQSTLRHLGISAEDARLFERLASRTLYHDPSLRAGEEVIAANQLAQPGLWGHGVSGDLPILLVRVVGDSDLELARQSLLALEYWRLKGLSADVVILNDHPASYFDEMHAQLTGLLDSGAWRAWKHRPGGVFLLRADNMTVAERTLLETVARAILRGDRGDLRAQLDRPGPPHALPAAATLGPSTAPAPMTPDKATPLPAMTLSNGRGGFTDGGRCYAIVLDGADETPLPWVNVIANPSFGTIVSAGGSGHTWSANSRENRLTSFTTDFVVDPTSEAIFVRDDDSGVAWCPTPGPMRRDPTAGRIVIKHGAGRTQFERTVRGIRHELDVYVDVEAPVKYSLLTLRNDGDEARHLSVYWFNDWVLGPPREPQHWHVTTWRDEPSGAVFARSVYTEEYAQRVAFVGASEPAASATGSRESFIGRNGTLSRPAALDGATLNERFGAGLDPGAALQVNCTLAPGESRSVLFVLGQGVDEADARALVQKHSKIDLALAALQAVEDQWNATLGTIQVRTPDDSFDTIMNQWLLYQDISCRLWSRAGYYQPGGAYGFRDQLQDVLALFHCRPDLARTQIVRAASRQFIEGDVQHWWHEPSGKGLRSRCSDDMLWLPYVAAEYVRTTGDASVLTERAAFLEAPPLPPDQHEVYGLPSISKTDGTIFEHCVRAIDRAITAGPHGLPLMGSCDWNDGMNRVGIEGRGESTWLGFFLYDVLNSFVPICGTHGDRAHGDRFHNEARRLAAKLELSWDGDWYRRGYYDDGMPLGSAQNDECRIDSIAQSWAVLSGAVPARFQERAMDAVRAFLISRGSKIILLLTPPFDRSAQDPGYIKGYPPGIRENGGQYTHAAVWVVMALAKLGAGDEAVELFHMLNPINHARTSSEMEVYKTEPYVLCGDVYARPPHAGRGGWSWYTGSAGWLYRAGLESLLGLKRRGTTFTVEPCIPESWDAYEIDWRVDKDRYQIAVTNPQRRNHGVTSVTLDGAEVDARSIPIVGDGQAHRVLVTMG